jgi:hypothetical protein
MRNDANTKVELKVRRDGQVQTLEYFPRGASRDILQYSPK